MDREEKIKKLIKERGYTLKDFSNKIDMPYSTLHSILSRGIGNASIDNIIKICNGLKIKVEDLEKNKEKELKLTNDEKEILYLYNQLSENDKIKLKGYIEGLIDSEKENISKKGA